jgi:glucosamine 6-phosphate synthetase-like amidotransferase/phosphosugar isomerase protein
MIDLMLLWKKKRTIINCKNKLIHDLKKTQEHGGRIYLVASGTSYHATLVAGFFFNIHARLAVIPANPGMFRSLFIDSLTPRDIVIGVSQSGETKDLVDIFNDIREKSKGQVSLITVVNNENSTLPQEKSDYYLPILCGPEIAVAATKSFISQTALFYILAASVTESESAVIHTLEKIRYFMEFTLKTNDNQVAEAALKLFLRPSMHILGTSFIGLAKEGALKIREVVLNHTEGYDSAEFKHGPNTILGKNTIFSLADMEKLHADIMECFEHLVEDGFIGAAGSTPRLLDFLAMLKNLKLSPCDESIIEKTLPPAEQASMLKAYQAYNRKISTEHYFSSYPLLFICPPDERDKRITISQIHTHKIRGADIILIAEEDAELKKAVLGKPAGFEHYYAQYITLPKTGDRSIFMFQAAVILQLLAFKMSVAKMKYLNRAKIDNHGVHPDVPKNVSKSITVD